MATADWLTQTRKGLLELCILALIEGEPTYGYEIVTRLAAAPPLAAGEGTIYPLLRRLREEGWLRTYWKESEAGPPRQYYELTASGSRRLVELRSQWTGLTGAVAGALNGRLKPQREQR
jgi:PadR family transcriptional regulator PadR